MLKRINDIDAVFRKGLSDYEVAPESYVWEAIEKSLTNQRKQRRTLIIWRSLAAACIAGLVIVGLGVLYYVSEPMVSTSAQLTPTGIDEQQNDSESPMAKEYHAASATVSGDEQYDKAALLNTSHANTFEKKIHEVNDEPTIGGAEMVLLARNTQIELKENYQLDTQPHIKQEKVYYPIYTNPSQGIVKKKNTISVGGVVSPTYNSKVSYGGAQQNYLQSAASLDESGISSLGGGLQVRLNTGSRWSFESGVLYSQVGQSVKGGQTFDSKNELNSRLGLNTALSNSLGSIVAKDNSSELFFSPAPTNDMQSAVMNLGNAYVSVKQTLDYIEVPMIARYSLFESFPYVSVAGGLSSNFLVNNTAYAVDGNAKEAIGETSDIKPFVLSSSLGVGVDVPISKTLRFSLEPRFKYFLNSVSSNDAKSFHPYSFGVYGGIIFVVR